MFGTKIESSLLATEMKNLLLFGWENNFVGPIVKKQFAFLNKKEMFRQSKKMWDLIYEKKNLLPFISGEKSVFPDPLQKHVAPPPPANI